MKILKNESYIHDESGEVVKIELTFEDSETKTISVKTFDLQTPEPVYEEIEAPIGVPFILKKKS